MICIFKIVWFLFIFIKSSNHYNTDVTTIDAIENFCATFSSCQECKAGSPQCDWCHDIGCTRYPNTHCPQKGFLDKTYNKAGKERICNEIEANDPIFIPANLRRFIKMKLKIDDLTLYKRSVICEIHIEETILRVKATISDGILYCDMTILKISRSVSLGYIRILWGGADPYSNLILIIVYRCQYMASDCLDCQVLDRGFNCGWCQETLACSLLEECPRQIAPWINKKSSCHKYQSEAYYKEKHMVPLLQTAEI